MLTRRPAQTRRSQRALRAVEPKLVENTKSALFLKGTRSSAVTTRALAELHALKKPDAVKFSKNNEFYPFEAGMSHLEFLCFKNDTSLFCFGSHQKKRPHNLILGRLYDFQELDMVELGITSLEPSRGAAHGKGCAEGGKPLLCFLGSHFDTNDKLKRVANLLVDFFRGKEVKSVNLAGLDRVICVVAKPPEGGVDVDQQSLQGYKLLFRHYAVCLLKGETSLPKVELVPVGPHFDFTVRRSRLAEADLFRQACRVPRAAANQGKAKKGKGLSHDGLANLRGQVHVGETDLQKLVLRKFKAGKVAKRRRQTEAATAEAEAGEDGDALAKPVQRVRKDKVERELLPKAMKKRKVK